METLVFESAVKAYNEYMREHGGYIFSEPLQTISEIDENFVYLANHSGLLAKYEISTGEIIIED